MAGLAVPGRNKHRNVAHKIGGSPKNETVKYGHESRGTQIQERLRWRGPGAAVNYNPTLSSERTPNDRARNCLKIISAEEKNKLFVSP
jgi:hypothetical protein